MSLNVDLMNVPLDMLLQLYKNNNSNGLLGFSSPQVTAFGSSVSSFPVLNNMGPHHNFNNPMLLNLSGPLINAGTLPNPYIPTSLLPLNTQGSLGAQLINGSAPSTFTSSSIPALSAPETPPPSACLVCGDVSKTKHYGVHSCSGCSNFFQRTVRHGAVYYCRNNKWRCRMDKSHRNACQGCRFKKCLEMGMDKKAVNYPKKKCKKVPTAAPKAPIFQGGEDVTDIEHDKKDVLYDVTKSHLEKVMRWVQHVSLFTLLDRSQKRQLVLAQLPHLLCLSMCEHPEQVIPKHLSALMDKFTRLAVSETEFNCLKFIVLYLNGEDTNNPFEKHLDMSICSLQNYCHSHDPNPSRFGKLMMLVSEIQHSPPIGPIRREQITNIIDRFL